MIRVTPLNFDAYEANNVTLVMSAELVSTISSLSFSAGSDLNPEQDSLDGQMPSGRSMLVTIEPSRSSPPGNLWVARKNHQ